MKFRETIEIDFLPEELGRAFINMSSEEQVRFLAEVWREVKGWDGKEPTATKLERQLTELLKNAENYSSEALEFLAVMRGVLKEMR